MLETYMEICLLPAHCVTLTSSLPQPVIFLGRKLHGHACKQYIFWSYNIYFQCCAFWWKSFHMPVQKKKTETLNGFKFYTFVGCFQVTSWQSRGYTRYMCAFWSQLCCALTRRSCVCLCIHVLDLKTLRRPICLVPTITKNFSIVVFRFSCLNLDVVFTWMLYTIPSSVFVLDLCLYFHYKKKKVLLVVTVLFVLFGKVCFLLGYCSCLRVVICAWRC